MNRSEITSILAAAGLRPQHKFGQNFMVDQNILHAIAAAGNIQPDDVILEVGPGVGNLTRLLATQAHRGHVLAVDIDRQLLPAAQRHHADLTNVTWLIADGAMAARWVAAAMVETARKKGSGTENSARVVFDAVPFRFLTPP